MHNKDIKGENFPNHIKALVADMKGSHPESQLITLAASIVTKEYFLEVFRRLDVIEKRLDELESSSPI